MANVPANPSERRDRVVTSRIEADVATEADLMFAIAVAADHDRTHEHLSITLDGRELGVTELDGGEQGRLHLVEGVAPGRLVVDYEATVAGSAPAPLATMLDAFRYGRPSRYCESDELSAHARSEFGGRDHDRLLADISSWVGANIAYVPGSSRPTDGAVATLLGRRGVCRDFAHLAATLLRANEVAARVVSVYAPGLDPMDFHAVTEAWVNGIWRVVDSTCLAPRQSMVRIATGADASDTAFMTTMSGIVDLVDMEVSATIDGDLPIDDITELVSIR